MLPHQCRLHSRRRDNRSHNSGFCILDVYSHMPVRRSGCLSGRLHRHRLRLLCCAAAGSGQKIYPSVGQQKCADNGIKIKMVRAASRNIPTALTVDFRSTSYSPFCIDTILSVPFRALYAQYVAKISEADQTRKNALRISSEAFFVQVGDYLFSRAVSSELSSAQVSLTSVFGMGTGGTSPSSTPTDLTEPV